MASQSKGSSQSWDEIDAKLQINVRDDLMANLGGDFLLALDGPVLPTPSWKVVIEVNDPDQLENTLERMVQAVNSQTQGTKAHTIAIEPSAVGFAALLRDSRPDHRQRCGELYVSPTGS